MRRIILTTTDASGGAVNSSPALVDIHGLPQVSIQIIVTGTVNYTVQQTLDDLNDPNVTPTWFSSTDAAVVGATASKQSSWSVPVGAIRVVQNSGTGSTRATVLQAGEMKS